MLSKPTRQAQTEAEAKFKRRQDQARDGMKAAAEYEAAAVAMREKTARLRAQRLAREAADKQTANSSDTAGKGKKK